MSTTKFENIFSNAPARFVSGSAVVSIAPAVIIIDIIINIIIDIISIIIGSIIIAPPGKA